MTTRFTHVVVAACLAATSTTQAQVLDGHTVATTDFHGIAPDMTTTIGPVNSVVGAGVELESSGWSDFVRIDFSDNNILITLNMDQPFGYFEVLRFADANDTIPDFTGVTVNPATNYAGFHASRIFFNSNMIDVNVTALHGLRGQQISLDLVGPSGAVSVDIRPRRCANVLRTASRRLLPVAILGSPVFDVGQIDPASVRLQRAAAVQSRTVDASGVECTSGPDGYPDLLLRFRIRKIVATLGTFTNGETRALTVTGRLKEEFGGGAIQGEDVVLIRTPK